MKTIKNIFSLIVAVVLLTFTISCTKKEKQLPYGLNVKDTLRVNISSEPPTIDWSKATDTTSSNIISNIMEGLTEFDLDDPQMKVIPSLATEWQASADAKTWTFNLRHGVKWTDGVEFEAQHLVDGWERLLNPKTAAEYAYFLFSVKGAKEYNEGKLKDFSQVGVKALDKYKIQVTLSSGMSFFPMLLTHESTFPIRKDIVEKEGELWAQPGKIVTLGPFTLKVWDHDKNIVLERYENYYGKKPAIKNVLAYMIVEQSSAVGVFDGGNLDIIPELPSNDIRVLKNRKEYRKGPALILQYYGFNIKKKPFDNILIRKAFDQAIDRTEITNLLAAGQIPATSWIPNGMLGHSEKLGLKFDPVKAKELLKQAGVTDPSKLPRITLSFNTNENHAKVAENVQQQLKRNIGVNIEVASEDWKVYLNKLKTDPPSLFRMGWNGDYPDPDNFLNLMTSYSLNNYTKWSSSKYDSLIAQGMSQLNSEKRKQTYDIAHKILVEDDVPVIPLWFDVRQYLIADRVKGYKLNPLDKKTYKTVSLEQR